jgi:hypothetical protein
MPKHTGLILALATLSATAAVSLAQNADPSGQDSYQTNNAPMQTQAAPIERGGLTSNGYTTHIPRLTAGQIIAPTRGVASAQPGVGIYLRVADHSTVRAIAVGDENTQLRVEQGIANISIHNPANHAQILVDLPGGQISLLKDGFYTFNADSNTVRVIKGEAFAYPGANTNQKPLKVKEDHAVVFNGPNIRPFEFDPMEASADLVPYPHRSGGYGNPGYGGGPYGYASGGYPYGYYVDPYYYDDPFFYGYPFGWGLGFYGGWGFYGGRGFYGRGFGGRGGWGGGGFGGGRGGGGRGR